MVLLEIKFPILGEDAFKLAAHFVVEDEEVNRMSFYYNAFCYVVKGQDAVQIMLGFE